MAEVAVEHASLASDVLQKHLHILPAVYISCKNRSGDGGCDEDVLNHRDRGRHEAAKRPRIVDIVRKETEKVTIEPD
jgi:hypothetical protein